MSKRAILATMSYILLKMLDKCLDKILDILSDYALRQIRGDAANLTQLDPDPIVVHLCALLIVTSGILPSAG